MEPATWVYESLQVSLPSSFGWLLDANFATMLRSVHSPVSNARTPNMPSEFRRLYNGGPLVSLVKVENRRSERLLLNVPIFCAMTSAWGKETSNDGMVFDVSNEGVRIMSMSGLSAEPGDAVMLWLGEPGHSKTMKVRAVVRWRERHEYGLEFATDLR